MGTTFRDSTIVYLDFSPPSRSLYVVDIYTSKQQRLSFPAIVVLLSARYFCVTRRTLNVRVPEVFRYRKRNSCMTGAASHATQPDEIVARKMPSKRDRE